ncbi:MAG: YggS family pyridoxal phosphate-dependent enzyme [Chitinophagaceae bacterium]|nr:YggS family pyridoxal phosphate-dependent enzyme [Chitinophagaceae bacterium]
MIQLPHLHQQLETSGARLVAVSKTKSVEEILELYHQGQRIFGENKVQELCDKFQALPKDIEWHLIGHLQTNKVKYIAPFVHLIHSVDSLKLLFEIDKQAEKCERVIPVLLQIHIAAEDTKFGLDRTELVEVLEYYCSPSSPLQHVQICGLMGMATNTEDEQQIHREFETLRELFQFVKSSYLIHRNDFKELSMGMSGDYQIALQHGSTLVRIGSLLFGSRS